MQSVKSNSKSVNSKLKKEQKIAAKNLNAEFESVSGESSNVVSELSNGILKPMPEPASSASSVTSELSAQYSSSVITTENHEPVLIVSTIEAELVISHLRKATTEVLRLSGADPQSKKLLEALVEMVVGILQTVPEERDRIDELLKAKTRTVFVCLLLFLVAMALTVFFTSGPKSSFRGLPRPT